MLQIKQLATPSKLKSSKAPQTKAAISPSNCAEISSQNLLKLNQVGSHRHFHQHRVLIKKTTDKPTSSAKHLIPARTFQKATQNGIVLTS